MIKKLLVFFLTIFTMTAYAQNVTMTGTVVDTDNLPLIGVNVVIKGTSTTTTNVYTCSKPLHLTDKCSS